MSEQSIARLVWESVRPAAEAFGLLSDMGEDADELVDLETKWKDETLPYLQAMDLSALLQNEISRRIQFAEERIKKSTDEYESSGAPFARRRYLMEERIPVCENYLHIFRDWRQRQPHMDWQPQDVVDIKRVGMQKFIRFNLERFYERN